MAQDPSKTIPEPSPYQVWYEERLMAAAAPEPPDSVKAALIQSAATLAAMWCRIDRDRWLADPNRNVEENPAEHPGDLMDKMAHFYHLLARYQDWTRWPPE